MYYPKAQTSAYSSMTCIQFVHLKKNSIISSHNNNIINSLFIEG